MDHDIISERGLGEPVAAAPPEPVARPHPARPLSLEVQALAAEIATALGETAPDPVGQIARAVDRLGPARRARSSARPSPSRPRVDSPSPTVAVAPPVAPSSTSCVRAMR